MVEHIHPSELVAEGGAYTADTQKWEEVQAAIDYIRPAIQADGGDIDLVSVDGDRVRVRLAGACDGCPAASFTLIAGVDRIVKEMAPWVVEVVADGVQPVELSW